MPDRERTYLDLSRPIREFTFVVDATEEGGRLDALLRAHYPWKSRTSCRRMVEQGQVCVDERVAKPATRVRQGAQVTVRLPDDPTLPQRESADDLVFLYEDEHLAAVDKPSGMAVHPTGRTRHGTLINKLHARYRSEDPRHDIVPRLSHRIDLDTSGVVLIVKNRAVDAALTEAFTQRVVQKTYLAVVRGVPAPREGLIDAPLGPRPELGSGMHQGVLENGGLPARSRWRVLEAYPRHALVELSPLSGRTHQLRVHLAHLGHPIVCDHLYGDLRPLRHSDALATALPHEAALPHDPALPLDADPVLIGRLALHAHRILFDHPVTGERTTIESPLPDDLKQGVAALALAATASLPTAGSRC